MWRKHISKSSGKPMVIVTYYGELLGKPITEYLTIGHGGIAGEKAMRNLYAIASKSGAVLTEIAGMNEDDAFEKIAVIMTNSTPPSVVEYKINGKFYDVIRRNWSGQNE
jgi:hypothetical protein